MDKYTDGKKRILRFFALQGLLSLAPAFAAAAGRLATGAAFSLIEYLMVPLLCGACAYVPTKRGLEPYAALWLPAIFCAAAYGALWSAAPLPGQVLLDILLAIPGSCAGKAVYLRHVNDKKGRGQRLKA